MLRNFVEGLQAVLVPEKQNIGEVAFGESFGGRCVNALTFAGET